MIKNIILITLFGFILSGCSLTQGSKIVTGGIVQTNLSENTIQIKNYAFDPSDLDVVAGTEITVVNDDSVAHTITSDQGKFDTGQIQPGETVKLTVPDKAGTYAFHCTNHPYMRGSLSVTAAPTPTPTE